MAASRKPAASGAGKAVSATSPKKDSTLKQMSSVRPARHVADEGPGQRIGRPAAERLGLGVRGDEGVAARGGARVVGAAGADAGQRLGQRADERVALGPGIVRDDDAGAEMQLNPALFTNIVAMCSAW